MSSIVHFRDGYFFMSNFYRMPNGLYFDGRDYQTAEHAFQASKTFGVAQRRHIRQAPNPTEAKMLGRRVDLRPDWETVKYEIMWQILVAKFDQCARIAEKLENTGDTTLIEGNSWHDNFWGHCFCNRGLCAQQGMNWLGKMLMQVRKEIREGRTGVTAIRVWSGHV